MALMQSPHGGKAHQIKRAGVQALVNLGWEVLEPDEPEPTAPEIPEGDPDDSWSVKQLRAYAREHDVDLGGATRKDDILDALAGTGDDSDDE